MSDDPLSADGSGSFPTTHWSQLAAARGPMTPQRQEVLNCLIRRYWKPVYVFCHRRGGSTNAADWAQDFFVHTLQRELFGRADRVRGRFRSYLLACLKNFLADVHRWQRRHGPPAGIVSIHQLAAEEGLGFEPPDNETPDAQFYRAWVHELLARAWSMLQQEYAASGQRTHAELLRLRVLDPILTGAEPPPMSQLAQQFGLQEKQACNCMLSARRAFQRLLRAEISIYACSEEEVAAEIQELFRFARP